MGDAGRRRKRVGPTDEWDQLELLCRWPEQFAYEETGSSERSLYRKIAGFEAGG